MYIYVYVHICIERETFFLKSVIFQILRIFSGLYVYINMNIVHTNKYNKKLQLPGALNIQETPGYKQK